MPHPSHPSSGRTSPKVAVQGLDGVPGLAPIRQVRLEVAHGEGVVAVEDEGAVKEGRALPSCRLQHVHSQSHRPGGGGAEHADAVVSL